MQDGTAVSENVGKIDPRLSVWLGDKALGWAKAVLTPARCEAVTALAEKAGHYALLAAAAAGLLYGIIGGIKTDTLSVFVVGVVWVFLVGIVQYMAGKFSSAGRMLIGSGPSELSSPAFLSCLALLNLVIGIAALVGLSITAVRAQEWGAFGMAAAVFALCELVVCLCLNPELLNIAIRPASNPGQEAIGVLTFFLKTFLRLVPIGFGVGAVCGALGLLWAIVGVLRGATPDYLFAMPVARLVLFAGALPCLGYLLYVLLYLIDLARSVLILPSKVDALKDK